MSFFGRLRDRVFTSFRWRLGLYEQKIRLARIEDKLDFLLGESCLMNASLPREDIIGKGGLPVVFIADKRYFEPAQIAIMSLLCNAAPKSRIDLYLILSGCDECDRQLVGQLFPGITVIQANPPEDEKISHAYVSDTALLKFDLPELLPELDSVLYLDCDISVREDIAPIFECDLTEVYTAAVKDCGFLHSDNAERKNNRKKYNYFNSGILLLNLKKMRSDHIREKLHQERKRNRNHRFVDQDCFNQVFGDKVKYLPLKYNVYYDHIVSQEIPEAELSEIYGESVREIREALHHPILFHQTPKPWQTTQTFGYGFYLQMKTNLEKMKLRKS